MVVELNPIANHTAGVLLTFEATVVRTLLLQRSDQSLDHAVLLWALWRDELLLQAITAH